MWMYFVRKFFESNSRMLTFHRLYTGSCCVSYEIGGLFRFEFVRWRHSIQFLIWSQIQISEYFHFLIIDNFLNNFLIPVVTFRVWAFRNYSRFRGDGHWELLMWLSVVKAVIVIGPLKLCLQASLSRAIPSAPTVWITLLSLKYKPPPLRNSSL